MSDKVNASKVMILGTYHFGAAPGHAVDIKVADITSEQKQKEILDVIEALAKFNPTKIAVESPRAGDENLNKIYQNYCKNQLKSAENLEGINHRNEIVQIAFRLANKLNHKRIYPIDFPMSIPFGEVVEYAKEHSHEFCNVLDEYIEKNTKFSNELQQTSSVRHNLRYYNSPDFYVKDHNFYLYSNQVGAGDTYVGVENLLAWYNRNLHIFSNLQDITSDNDRVLVLFGAGHCAILRQFIESYSTMELVEPLDYL